MQRAVVSCEFLMAPAFGKTDVLENFVLDLVDISKGISYVNQSVILEENLLDELNQAGLFPTENFFKENLSRSGCKIFSSRDIARVVNKIINNGCSMPEFVQERIADWEGKSTSPSFESPIKDRNEKLEAIIESIVLANEFDGRVYSLLYIDKKNELKCLDFQGNLSSVFPDVKDNLPFILNSEVSSFDSYRKYLSNLDAMLLYNEAREDVDYIHSFYVGALIKLAATGKCIDSFDMSCFCFGPDFLSSVLENQCGAGGEFASIFHEVITSILSSSPKYEISIFGNAAGSEKAKISGNYKAYRTHVTKHGPALRLMFWINDIGHIVFANVGPKNELKICKVS